MNSKKSHEFRVIIEKDLPEEFAKELEIAIRSATLKKFAEIDFSREMSVESILEEFDHTKGMILR